MRILRAVDTAEIGELLAAEEFFWLDLEDPDAESVEEAGRALGLHKLALEDTVEFGQRPKAEVYGDQLLLVYFGAAVDERDEPVPVEVHLHISHQFVFTVHRDTCETFDRMRERLGRRPPANEHLLIYHAIDALTDSVLEVAERVADRVEDQQTMVIHRPRASDRDRMAMLRRALQSFRRVIVTQRQVFARVIERICELPGLEEEFHTYYRDVGDHLWRAIDEIEAARDSLLGMLDTYTNEVQERLTIVATIFLPLTVITGFFGQNFTWMINHIGASWAFWGLGVGGLVGSSIVIMAWLTRSGLYSPPGRRRRPRRAAADESAPNRRAKERDVAVTA